MLRGGAAASIAALYGGLLYSGAACSGSVKLPEPCAPKGVEVQTCGYCAADGACMEVKRACVPACASDDDCPSQAFSGCDTSLKGCVPLGGCERLAR